MNGARRSIYTDVTTGFLKKLNLGSSDSGRPCV